MKTPSKLQESTVPVAEDDLEAQVAAREAQEQGTSVIRNHLDCHLQNNPNSTFVSWISCLHPENATVSIDPRFFIPGNPWMTVWEEAKSRDLPIAHARKVEEVDGRNQDTQVRAEPVGSASQEVTHEDQLIGGPFAILLGNVMMIVAIATSWTLELAGAFVYVISWAFWRVTSILKDHLNCFTFIFFGLFFFLSKALHVVDWFLLFCSVLLTEVLSMTCLLLTLIFGGCAAAKFWHQKTRKMAHLVRWAFRISFADWNPPRTSVCSGKLVEQVSSEGQNVNDHGPHSSASPTIYTRDGVVIAEEIRAVGDMK